MFCVFYENLPVMLNSPFGFVNWTKTSYKKTSAWALGNDGGHFQIFFDILYTELLIWTVKDALIYTCSLHIYTKVENPPKPLFFT